MESFISQRLKSIPTNSNDNFETQTIFDVNIDNKDLFGYAVSRTRTEYIFGGKPLVSMYKIDGHIEPKSFDSCCGLPINVHKTVNGEIRVYGENQAIRISDGKVMEYWRIEP